MSCDNINYVVTEFLVKGDSVFFVRKRKIELKTGGHMQSKEKSVMNKIGKVYGFFSKHIRVCCVLILVILALCVILDRLDCPYFCKAIENFFTYDTTNIVAVILVIWTFTATLVVFYLERMESRRYGIRMITIILRSYSEGRLLVMTATFMTELVILIMASVVTLSITLVVSSVIQFATMLYVFLMVITETSDDHFTDILISEYRAVPYSETMRFGEVDDAYKDLMIVKMIRNLDYGKYDNLEALEELLHSNDIDKKWTNVRKYVSRKITQLILESGENRRGVKTLILHLFAYEKAGLGDKKGILMALIENLDPQNLEITQILLDTESRYQENLYSWCIVLNFYLSEFNDGKWRTLYSSRFLDKIKNETDDGIKDLLMDCAKEINVDFDEKDPSWATRVLEYVERWI